MLTEIPNGLDEIIAAYGSLDEPHFENKYIVSFDLPYMLRYEGQVVRRSRCHKVAVDNFVQALRNVEAAGLADQFVEYNGIYAKRAIRGQSAHPSLHSWGVAIDMGASTHPLGGSAQWPQGIMDAFSSAGFFWGGNFRSRKDPMHWQLATGY
jgi:hypothetical protein